jgi:hypothetical protein
VSFWTGLWCIKSWIDQQKNWWVDTHLLLLYIKIKDSNFWALISRNQKRTVFCSLFFKHHWYLKITSLFLFFLNQASLINNQRKFLIKIRNHLDFFYSTILRMCIPFTLNHGRLFSLCFHNITLAWINSETIIHICLNFHWKFAISWEFECQHVV